MLQPGDKVRLAGNPSRVGILSNETDGPPERTQYLVRFLDGDEDFFLLDSLEKVEKENPGPWTMLRDGHYGRTEDLRGLITHHRLSGRLENLIYSLNATNTDFLAYQFKPVLQYLDSPSHGLLIADEVGLGKTIEAGLIWTEIRARMDSRRLLVLCPAILCEKWRRELSFRFGVEARIEDAHGVLQQLKQAQRDPRHGFALIASIQGLRPPRGWDSREIPSERGSAQLAHFLSEHLEQPLIDLVVIDEAHYLRNQETQSHRLGQLVRSATIGLLLLTATPIQLRNRDLFNLVHLLDPASFPFESSFDSMLLANEPLVELREKVLRSHLTTEDFQDLINQARSAPLLADSRQLRKLSKTPPSDSDLASPARRAELADQLGRINPLSKIVTRTLKRDVHENLVERQPHVIRVPMDPLEKMFYEKVTERVRQYCKNYAMTEGFMLTSPQRQMSSCMAAASASWKKRSRATTTAELENLYEEAFGTDVEDTQQGSSIIPLLVELAEISRELSVSDELEQVDTKFAFLLDHLNRYWSEHPGSKVILFSFYRGTLDYLQRRLRAANISCHLLYGGMDKQAIIDSFKAKKGPGILLSSEVASEGVDLQFSSLLINYDLPWNPARIEQRIGRIDRIGQRKPKVLIWNLVHKNTIDERIHDRLLDRLDIFRQALGSMEATLGEETRKLGYHLLSHDLTAEQEIEQIDGSQVALKNTEIMEKELEAEAANLIAHGEHIQNEVRAARQLGRYIRGIDLKNYIADFFLREYEGCSFIRHHEDDDKNSLVYQVRLSSAARVDFEYFLTNDRGRATTYILHSTETLLKFDNTAGAPKPGVEKVTQSHPLVRFVTERTRKKGRDIGYLSTSALKLAAGVNTNIQPGTYVYVIHRWSISGARVFERLVYSACNLSSNAPLKPATAEKLINHAAQHGKTWLAANNTLDGADVADTFQAIQHDLRRDFERHVEAYRMENDDRIEQTLQSLAEHLERKRKATLSRINDYKSSGDKNRLRMIPAERGRFKKEEARILLQIEKIRHRKALKTKENFVSAGVIHVN